MNLFMGTKTVRTEEFIIGTLVNRKGAIPLVKSDQILLVDVVGFAVIGPIAHRFLTQPRFVSVGVWGGVCAAWQRAAYIVIDVVLLRPNSRDHLFVSRPK